VLSYIHTTQIINNILFNAVWDFGFEKNKLYSYAPFAGKCTLICPDTSNFLQNFSNGPHWKRAVTLPLHYVTLFDVTRSRNKKKLSCINETTSVTCQGEKRTAQVSVFLSNAPQEQSRLVPTNVVNKSSQNPPIKSRQRLGTFLHTTVSRLALESTQLPTQWVSGALSLGVKWTGREADHLPQSSVEVKSTWSYISTPQYAFIASCSVTSLVQLYPLSNKIQCRR